MGLNRLSVSGIKAVEDILETIVRVNLRTKEMVFISFVDMFLKGNHMRIQQI